ncbi:hypothetical protein EV421DRAFT_1741778 [Armillaria borealis]|uniref:Uncharacterized protein n=1 Tax=Armillaria borealis TaxID=47425 RepID=A0AA39IZ52_9AGAR|nr:hypothetical protein EV421DRAFT_1741778 [Armillaria borealis]
MSQATADAPPTTQGAAAVPPDGDHSPCMYTDYQADRFMEELYALWFQDWPEPPENVQRRKNSLHRAMLAVSHERLPDLTFDELGLTPHFTPVMPNDTSSSASTMAMQPGPAASGTTAESH